MTNSSEMSARTALPMAAALLAGTMLGGMLCATPAMAQAEGDAPALSVPIQASQPIKAINIEGQQRLEPETILSYTKLRVGGSYTRESLDSALRDLYETELFADVRIRDDAGTLTITVK
ncbi:MAG: POTRA domain-containing protein, partial [Sphingobium sp.]